MSDPGCTTCGLRWDPKTRTVTYGELHMARCPEREDVPRWRAYPPDAPCAMRPLPVEEDDE